MATLRKALLFMGLMLPLVACVALTAPLAALKATPTPSPSSTDKPTLSPTLRPSFTAKPTQTPTEFPSATLQPTLTLTPTVLFVSPSPTPTAQSRLACKLIWQSPGNYITYKPDQSFTVGWKVMNNGTEVWNVDSVVFTYLRGAKLYDYSLVQLVTSVAPGQEVVLSVHMRAPTDITMYTTTWSLREGDTFFCPLKLSIYVY